MRRAESAKERKAIIDEMCRIFAFSTAKAYKVLKESGWESGRKKRRDAGKSSVAEDTIKTVAALTKHSLRKNGKQVMPVTVARSVLLQNGWNVPVKNSRLRELLREQQLQTAELKKACPYQNLRSLYPNHVHMADPSVSLLYYSPSGKQKIVRDDEEYKNKSFLEGKEKCLRYVLIDHYSASICVRYYAAHGETASNMYDFLLYAWGQKKLPTYTFHGLPELLYWDKGSGNINKATSTALEALRVKTETHEAGNPRSKGAVEIANNIVETHFECLLKLEAVHSIDELNEAVERLTASENYKAQSEVLMELEYTGFIPDAYVRSAETKMEIYKKIASVQTDDELIAVMNEIEDRFGPVPDEVASLLSLAEIRILCKKLSVSALKESKGVVEIEFAKVSDISVDRVLQLIKESSGSVWLDAAKPNMLFLKLGKIGLKEKSEFIRERLEKLA